MVDPRHRKAPVLEAPKEIPGIQNWRRAAFGVAAVAVLGTVWFIWSSVSEGSANERWGQLAAMQSLREETGESGRTWLDVPTPSATVHSRDEEISKLEAFLAKNASSPAVAAYTHALIANLQLTQALGLAPTARFADLKPRYDSADAHLAAIEENFRDAPINWDKFRPKEEASITKLIRKTLRANRTWDEAHGLKDVQPDPDVVVVFRTTRGDLRLRLFSAQSPRLAKAFLDRICANGYTGTSLFEKREETEETWVRGGDARTRKTDKEVPDAERANWGEPSPGEPLLPDEGRNLVLHTKGVVSAWHSSRDEDDDPVQFLIVAKDSPRLNYEYTPFARVEEISLATLDRILATPSRRQEKPAILSDAVLSKLADQLTLPATIVKSLIYEKGVLKVCDGSTTADESEKKLETLKPDAYLVTEPPPAPPKPPEPATPPTPTPADPVMDK